MTCPVCQQEHADGGVCPPPADLSVSERDPLVGKPLGDYGLVRELGRGSAGVVYLAEHLATGLNVAVKIAHVGADAAMARRLALEARFANELALETVVNVFDINDDDPTRPYLVMEYLQGETIEDLAARGVSADEALALLAQVADALGEAHQRHVVHAALKPSNVMQTLSDAKKPLAKLLPFGVAAGRKLDGEEDGDRVVTHLGSPDFRAPEQSLGAPPDPRMDVYSLGAIAYLLATGRVPFTAPTPHALERAHAEVVPVAPHRVNPKVSRAWSATILRALEKSPERRYAHGADFAQALRAAPSEPDPVGTTAMFVLGAEGASPSPLPQAAPVSSPSPAPPTAVAGGLADGFLVTTTPAPQRSPSTLSPAPSSAPTVSSSPSGVSSSPLGVSSSPPAVSSSPSGVSSSPPGANSPAVSASPSGVSAPSGVSSSPPAVSSSPSTVSPLPFATNSPRPSSPPGAAAQAPTQGLVLQVTVSDEKGAVLGDFACSGVTRAGLIVCTSGPLPPMLSRVKLRFTDLASLSCDAQVVHHVTREQAAQWKMSAGYGVQFGALSAEQRSTLESVHQGLKAPETPSGIARRPDDPAAEEVLKRFTSDRASDAYAMLAISKGAPFDAIKDRVRDAKRALEAVSSRPLSLAQQKAFDDARQRLEYVGNMLGTPKLRMEYDAERGNFEGVARCISAGISVTELEAARLRFINSHPGVAGKSHGAILAGQTLEARQQMPQALEAYADALRTDPLNLLAQQRYWAVRRQLEKA